MAITYQPVSATEYSPAYILRLNEDNTQSFIPLDPANSDYQAYLATLAANSATPQAGA